MTPSEARAKRRALDITQEQAGRVIGVGPAMISLYERGERTLSDTNVDMLEDFYATQDTKVRNAAFDEALQLAEQADEIWQREGAIAALAYLIVELKK